MFQQENFILVCWNNRKKARRYIWGSCSQLKSFSKCIWEDSFVCVMRDGKIWHPTSAQRDNMTTGTEQKKMPQWWIEPRTYRFPFGCSIIIELSSHISPPIYEQNCQTFRKIRKDSGFCDLYPGYSSLTSLNIAYYNW
jgi:hypothetical protein